MMFTTPFQKNLAWSAAAHVAFIGILILSLGLSPPDSRTEVKWVDMVSDLPAPPATPPAAPPRFSPPAPRVEPVEPAVPPSPAVPEPAIEPPHPPEPPPPEPEPVAPRQPRIEPPQPVKPKEASKPEVKPSPQPKAADKPKEPKPKVVATAKPRIQVNTNLVKRVIPAATPVRASVESKSPPAESFDPAAFKKHLLSKLPGALITAAPVHGTGTGASGKTAEFAWYYKLIEDALYAAWQPPHDAEEGRKTQVLLRIEKTGVISKVSLVKSSGNAPMDQTALGAANGLRKVEPLPKNLRGDFLEITINFTKQKT